MAFPRAPRTSCAFQSTRSRVLDTTYFFAAAIVRAKGSIQSGLAPVRAGGRNAASIILIVGHPAKEEGIGLVEVLDRVTMQVFVRGHCTMIAAPVQCDVDGIPKRPHYVRVPPDQAKVAQARVVARDWWCLMS